MPPAALAMAPRHLFRLITGHKAHRAAEAAALELICHRWRPLLCRDCLLWLPVELAQARHDLPCKEGDVRDRILVVQEAPLTKEQEMAKAPDAIVQLLDLVVDIVGRAGKAGGAFHQLIECGGR